MIRLTAARAAVAKRVKTTSQGSNALTITEAGTLTTSKIGSTDKEDLCLDTGHIGIYVSSKTQRQFAPKIIRWLTERDEAPEPVNVATKKSAAKKGKADEAAVRG